MKIRIVCHPIPKNYSLTKIATIAARSKRSIEDEEIDSDRYQVTFARIDEQMGEVTMTMFDVTDSDNGRYQLTVQNGVGQGLGYTFDVDVWDG